MRSVLVAAALLLAASPTFAARVNDQAAVAIAETETLIVGHTLLPTMIAAIRTPVDALHAS